MSDEHYIEALEEVVSQSKSSIGLSAAPLALLLAQMRYLVAVDNLCVSLLLTIAVISLAFATFGMWYLATVAHSTLAVEKWRRGGPPVKGQLYFSHLKELNPRAEADYSEEGLVRISRVVTKPSVYLMYLGYMSLALVILIAIWMPSQ